MPIAGAGEISDVRLHATNGHWYFESEEELQAVLGFFSHIQDQQRLSLEREHGVKSQYSRYFELVAQLDRQPFSSYEAYDEMVKANLSIMFMGTDSIHVGNYFSPLFAKVFNEDGLLQIGRHLVWADFNKVIYFPQEQKSPLPYIRRMSMSDESAGITVIPITRVEANSSREVCVTGIQPQPIFIFGGTNPQGAAITNVVFYDQMTINGRNRSDVRVEATQWWYPDNIFVTVSFQVKNQRKSGIWFGHKAGVDVSGTFELASNHPCSSFPFPPNPSCFIHFSVPNYQDGIAQDVTSEWIKSVISPYASVPYAAPVLDRPSGYTGPPFYWTELCAEMVFDIDFKKDGDILVSF